MERIFLDANILFSAAYRPDSGLLRLWTLEGVALVTSAYAAEEARRNLVEEGQRAALEALLGPMEMRAEEPAPRGLPEGVDLPDKDVPVLRAAIAAAASFFLTGDVRHFGVYFGKTIGGVTILPPGEYLRARRR
jgi:predicted nucleic acid-binding protein